MSARKVLTTVRAALEAPGTGLAARAAALALAEGLTSGAAPNRIRTDFAFVRWILTGQMQTATQPNVSVVPRGWGTELMLPNETHRDGDVPLQISYESFHSDPAEIEDNVTIVAAALAQVLDRLREFSDANAGTVLQVRVPVLFTFGPFAAHVGSVASSGFVCALTVHERGTE